MMHPDLLHEYATAQRSAAVARAEARREHRLARRARPPSRVRRTTASLLARVAAHLADEPVIVLPRRA